MLKQPVPTAARWIGGSALVLTLAVGVGFTAWSAQPKREVLTASQLSAGMLMTRMDVSIDGGKSQQFTMISKAGEPFAMRTEHDGRQWEMHATATPGGNGTIVLDTTVSRDGKVMGTPKLVVHEGKRAAIKLGEKHDNDAFEGITLEMMVTAAAPAAPPAPPAPPTPPAALAPPAPLMPVQAIGALPAAPPMPTLPPRPKAQIAPPPPPATPHALPGIAPPPPASPVPTSSPTAVDRSPITNPPKFPAELAKRGVSGNVVLLVDVSAEGNPTAIEVDESVPAGAFDATAIETAWKWKFQPAVENGKPVAGRVRVPVEFKAPVGVAPKAN